MKKIKILAIMVVLTLIFQLILSFPISSSAAVAVGADNKPQKISLGSFYRIDSAGTTIDTKTDIDGNLVQELNSSFNGQVGQFVRSVGFGANLMQAPYLIMKVKSANFPFQMMFRYTGGEWSDEKRTHLMIQSASQVSATEKTYIFDLRNYFRTDKAAGTQVLNEYSGTDANISTKNIAITNTFEECAVSFISVPYPKGQGSSVGDKIVISNLYLSPTADTGGFNNINTASYNKVPSGATRISDALIAQYTPKAVFNADNTIQITSAASTSEPIILSFESININEKPILFIDFKSAPTGVLCDFVNSPNSVRTFNSTGRSLQNFVMAVDLRNFYVNSDSKAIYLYNWNGYGTASTMVLNGIYVATETVCSSRYVVSNNNISDVTQGTTVTAFKNALKPSIGANLIFKDASTNILNDNGVDKIGTGTTMDITANGATKRFTIIILGDLNGDHNINSSDLGLMKKHLLHIVSLTGAFEKAGKISASVNVSIRDLLAIKKHILGVQNIIQGPYDLIVKKPEIISTVYATEDIVVADYVVTKAPYLADSTGVNDATVAIQTALTNCYNAGGGTVWVPAGTYKVTGTINVPSFVTLRGDWRDPDSGTGSYGTVIKAELASGDLGPVLFQIGGSAGVMGITTYYPVQSATNPVAYNYTFSIPSSSWSGMAGTYMASSVINCTMLNSYRGIGINALDYTKVHDNSTIKNVKGTALYRGVVAFNAADVGTWEHITFNNSYWANAGALYNAPNVTSLNAWTRANGTAFTFGDLEWEQFYGMSCTSYNIGVNIVAGFRTTFCGEFLWMNVIDSNIGVQVDSLDNRWGMSFLRCSLNGSTKAIVNNTAGTVKVTDSLLSGGTTGTITITAPWTSPIEYGEGSPSKVSRTVIYDVTQAPYFAPYNLPQTGIPTLDATAAIQTALTDAGNAGGGVVYLPAGWYRINYHLTVPANVELRGCSSVPTRDQGDLSYGTVLLGYEGKGTVTPDTDTAMVTLNGNTSGIRGIRFFYPENNPAAGTVSKYPFTIRGNGANLYAVNVGLTGVYNGIDFGTNRCDNHFIRKIIGVAYSKFIVVGPSTVGWIEGCLSNPASVDRNNFGISGWVTEANIFEKVINPITRVNEVLIIVNGASNEHILNVFGYGLKNGVKVTSGTVNIFNLGTDNLGTGGFGIVQTGGTVNVMNYMRYNGADLSGLATFYNKMNIPI